MLYIKYLSCIVKCKICLHCGCSGVLLAVKVKCGLCVCILVRIKNQWVCYFCFKILEVVCVSSLQIPPCNTLLCCHFDTGFIRSFDYMLLLNAVGCEYLQCLFLQQLLEQNSHCCLKYLQFKKCSGSVCAL